MANAPPPFPQTKKKTAKGKKRHTEQTRPTKKGKEKTQASPSG
jgi:hypothetical protein